MTDTHNGGFIPKDPPKPSPRGMLFIEEVNRLIDSESKARLSLLQQHKDDSKTLLEREITSIESETKERTDYLQAIKSFTL